MNRLQIFIAAFVCMAFAGCVSRQVENARVSDGVCVGQVLSWELLENMIIPEVNFVEADFYDVLDVLQSMLNTPCCDDHIITITMETRKNVQAPNITLAGKRVKMSDVLEIIASMAGYKCVINEKNIDFEILVLEDPVEMFTNPQFQTHQPAGW